MHKVNYVSYLKLNQLLELQQPHPNPREHDELLFIVVHQVYELWFKLMLHELEKVRAEMSQGKLWPAVATWKRLRTIMKTLVQQFDIVETMTPTSFACFRDRLDTASGFQSPQFRDLEYLLGYKREEMLKHQSDAGFRIKLEARLQEPSINDAFYLLLEFHGAKIPDEVKLRDPTLRTEPNEEIEDQLLVLYKSRPDIEVLCELMIDFDEGFQEWRYRHIKLAERTIGGKSGTGGSPGIEFLKQALFRPMFPNLWAIRHRL